MTRKETSATWALELWLDCPHCEQYFDYMSSQHYSDGGFESIEHGEENENLEIDCPKCNGEILLTETSY